MTENGRHPSPEKPETALETDLEVKIQQEEVNSNSKEGGEQSTMVENIRSQNASEGDAKSLQERLQALEVENAELKDRYLRKYAEFENYKKRILKDKEESAKFANSMLLLDLIGIIDDFERALKSAEANKDFQALHQGISMIEKQMLGVLEKKWGLVRFNAKGLPFDPERHEAPLAEESPEVEEALVAEDFQNGYLLHDRVLRPAKVKVIKPSGNNTKNPDSK